MSKGDFWQVTVRTTPSGEDVLMALLAGFFGEPVSVYTLEATKATDVTVYVHKARQCTPARMKRLRHEIALLRQNGELRAPVRVIFKVVRKQDWAESWKRHFKTIDIAGRLLVKPSWIKRKPRKGQHAIVLDPGLSFGTGKHPTTSYCLGELVRTRTSKPQSMLDIGTGSGLLAIAAVKLGYEPVEAFDYDPESIRVADENLTINGVRQQVRLFQTSVEKLRKRSSKQFDLVCANLLAELLVREPERIATQVKPGGRLVVAGILITQFAEVQKAFEALGFRLLRSRKEKEWRSGTLVRSEASGKGG